MADEQARRKKNVQLVREVEKHPCLYNSKLKPYLKKDAFEIAWTSISEAVEMPIHRCRSTWMNLREVFKRCHKIVKTTGLTGKPHYLYSDMQFLVPYVKYYVLNRDKSETSDTETDPLKELNESLSEELDIKYECEESSSDSEQTEPGNKRQRLDTRLDCFKQNDCLERSKQNANKLNDPVVSFLNSILPEFNEMTTQGFKMFKRRSLALIDEIKDVY